MNLKRFEELWSSENGQPYMICLLTCSLADFRGELVMNHGAEKQAKLMYPLLPRMALTRIKTVYPRYRLDGTEDYGFLEVIEPHHGIGIFQVRRHWATPTQKGTLALSIKMLAEYAKVRPELNIRLPYPNVAPGRWGGGEMIEHTEIMGMMRKLPDNVTVLYWGDPERPIGKKRYSTSGVKHGNKPVFQV